jgi:DNA-binding NarL/FixJ family response regulator
MSLRLILIEDQQLFRESVAALLRTKLGAEIVAVYSTAAAPLQEPEKLKEADLALVDVRLSDTEAFDLVAELRRIAPGLKLIWVTSIEEDYLLQRAFEANLPGFIHKEDSIEVLITAVQRVAEGGTYVSRSIEKLRQGLKSKPDYFTRILSPREQEVLRFIGAGFSNDEAAAMLGLSAGTIQAHRRNIMARIDVHSASELQAYALRHGFTSPKALKIPKK